MGNRQLLDFPPTFCFCCWVGGLLSYALVAVQGLRRKPERLWIEGDLPEQVWETGNSSIPPLCFLLPGGRQLIFGFQCSLVGEHLIKTKPIAYLGGRGVSDYLFAPGLLSHTNLFYVLSEWWLHDLFVGLFRL